MAGVPGLTKKVPAPVSKNNQLGGTGPDADKGKGRTQFEDDRRKGNQGGKDRPPVYKPNDDGERGGYVNRSKIPSLTPAGRAIKGTSAVHGMIPRY